MRITQDHLMGLLTDSEVSPNDRVANALEIATQDLPSLLRFMARYTNWNGYFGSSVATLAGKIGRARDKFLEPGDRLPAISDRSVLVASYFFDAARDEFNDRGTPHRDTHRCLAQSVLQGIVDFRSAGQAPWEQAELVELMQIPVWLRTISDNVATGYGDGVASDLGTIFGCMGYHLGSEVLADEEFSLLDRAMRESQPELTQFLRGHDVEIAGETHNAYYWIEIHSGHGGGVEADHLEWAVEGVHKAFEFVPVSRQEALLGHLEQGFLRFARDHETFFSRVNSLPGAK